MGDDCIPNMAYAGGMRDSITSSETRRVPRGRAVTNGIENGRDMIARLFLFLVSFALFRLACLYLFSSSALDPTFGLPQRKTSRAILD